MNKIIVTGCAGFIGFHVTSNLLKKKFKIIGIDNINDYYDPKLKKNRLKLLKKYKNFIFKKIDICNYSQIKKTFKNFRPNYVIHLAAQAGVRYSLEKPRNYLNSNIVGFFNIIESVKEIKCKHFLFASTSSVYGANEKYPFREIDPADNPIQFYAATKRSNEIIAHAYSVLHNIPCTGLRFFTVYGPWSRPDMALYKFAKNISNNKKIEVFNNGNHIRDFTYIDDISDGIIKCLKKPPKKNNNWNAKKPDPSESPGPFKIFNIGSGNPVQLKTYIKLIEKYLNKKAKVKYLKLQKGDIYKTEASLEKIKKHINYLPKYNVNLGIKKFMTWFKAYHKIK